ncbi:MAG: PQQ-binding-like beta-propeller repeat protein [bacterium]
MSRILKSIVWLVSCALLSHCGRSVVKPLQTGQTGGENWLMAGADRARTSAIASEVPLPLQEVARFKLSSAPAQSIFIRHGILFVPTLDGRLFVIDLAAKKVLSKKKLPGGNAATLAIGDSALVVASRYGKETLFYHDLKKTRQIWDVDAGDIAGEPLLADSAIYAAAIFNHIDAYRATDGVRLWRFDTEGQIYASPAMAENHVIVATTKGKIYALHTRDGKKSWERDVQQPVRASPVIRGQQVYVGTAHDLLVALDLTSGAEIWRKNLPARVFHAPAVSDSLLLVGASDGVVYAFDRTNGEQKWSTRAFSVIGTSPLIAGNEVFFGSLDHHVYCVNTANGELRWRQELNGRVRTNPLIWNKQLIIASEDRDLYIFGQPENLGTN